MPFLELDDVRLFYTDDLPDGAPAPGWLGVPTVLVHGWLGTSDSWIHLLPALRRRCRTVTVDLRGHGASQAPDSRYDAAEFAGDLARVLARLAPGPAVVLGHSMGASLASLLAVGHPELVAALVLVDPDYGGRPEERERLLPMARQPDPARVSRDAAGLVARIDAATGPDHLREWHRRDIERMPPFVVARSLLRNLDAPSSLRFAPQAGPLLARRRQPVLAFHRDPWREALERSHATAATRVLAVRDTGHWIHQERPEVVVRELEAWLRGLPPVTE
ncbi:alpha/beta fold hydrolase [Streptomyces sp. NPDC020983]|uniref:alpha/beta fold hydrolase n=1 Tax=Streptomyces sp. NPDC020983 TaxID=3365106 RepID=UPI0037B0A72B